jgi:hypothetical protein
MSEEALRRKEAELVELQRTYDEYVESSSELEHELEHSLEMAEESALAAIKAKGVFQTRITEMDAEFKKLKAENDKYRYSVANYDDQISGMANVRKVLEGKISTLEMKVRVAVSNEIDAKKQREAALADKAALEDTMRKKLIASEEMHDKMRDELRSLHEQISNGERMMIAGGSPTQSDDNTAPYESSDSGGSVEYFDTPSKGANKNKTSKSGKGKKVRFGGDSNSNDDDDSDNDSDFMNVSHSHYSAVAEVERLAFQNETLQFDLDSSAAALKEVQAQLQQLQVATATAAEQMLKEKERESGASSAADSAEKQRELEALNCKLQELSEADKRRVSFVAATTARAEETRVASERHIAAMEKEKLDLLRELAEEQVQSNKYVFRHCSSSLPFLVCDVCPSLSRSITACLHSLTLYDTSLTIISPSINHQSTQNSHTYYNNTGTARLQRK